MNNLRDKLNTDDVSGEYYFLCGRRYMIIKIFKTVNTAKNKNYRVILTVGILGISKKIKYYSYNISKLKRTMTEYTRSYTEITPERMALEQRICELLGKYTITWCCWANYQFIQESAKQYIEIKQADTSELCDNKPTGIFCKVNLYNTEIDSGQSYKRRINNKESTIKILIVEDEIYRLEGCREMLGYFPYSIEVDTKYLYEPLSNSKEYLELSNACEAAAMMLIDAGRSN